MTTDPTITIAGLRAQVSALESAATSAADNAARLVEALYHGNGGIAAITAERDALAAQLAKVRAELAAAPKVCAIHSYEHGPGPCMTCGAWPPGTRELIATCQGRIAGLEQAANERSKEVARLAARVAELEARPVLTAERLAEAMQPSVYGAAARATIAAATIASLGPVTLPAQDAADAIVAKMQRYGWWCSQDSGDGRCEADMRRALASLGAPPTSPVAARPVFAGVSEEELYRVYADAYGEPAGHVDDRRPIAIRAVLARLEVSLVAPVDPEAVARDYANNAATGYAPGIDHPPYWLEYTDEQRTKRTAAMRATLIARGIPVTPEAGK